MEKKHFWQNKPVTGLLLALSTLGALGLFRVPSSLVFLMLLGIFCLTMFQFLIHWKDPAEKPELHLPALFLALGFALMGFVLFPGNMAYTPSMSRHAESLHMPYLTFARVAAGLQILVGSFAFYRLGLWLQKGLCHLFSLPMKRRDQFPVSNLLLPLSALGFFTLEIQWSPNLIAAVIAAVSVSLAVSVLAPALISWGQQRHWALRLLAGLTAAGILLFRGAQADAGIYGIAASILGFHFVYLALLALYSWMARIFTELGTFRDLPNAEWTVYLCIFLAAVLFVTLVFFHTDAFYGTEWEFDVIYTADSPLLVQTNAYLSLRHQENDLRQPLFAVFAAPFVGLPYLIGHLLPKNDTVIPLLMQIAQIGLLLTANFLLTRLMKLDSRKRMLFMGITSLAYPVLLFLLMMEQYIVAYFWLILCIYLISEQKQQAELPLCGTAGTLLTGVILMPALSSHHPLKEFKAWFTEMLGLCLSFLLLMVGFGRMDTILDAPTQLLMMTQFSGQKLTALQKLYQYSGFFRQCLLTPEAGPDLESLGHPSWQLAAAAGFSILGIFILVLALLSVILNRKDRACTSAGWWLLFSFGVLFLLGWGTQENGLILYSLYFGWTVWVLLFRLFERLEARIPHAVTVLSILSMLLLAAVNLPGILAVIRFGCSYYPL